MHSDADMSAEMSEGRWLTYDQLAALRRIDKPSAIKLATRNRWQRRQGNAGQMQVCVPIVWLDRAEGRRDRYGDKAADMSGFEAAVDAIKIAHAGEIAALHAVITGKDGEVVVLRESLDRERTRADREEKARDSERARADSLEDQIATLQHDRDEARQKADDAVESVRQAEAERKARGLVARFRAAWRGD